MYEKRVVVPVEKIVNISHGTNSSVNNTHFYWVKIETTEGKITVASGIAGEPGALGLAKHVDRWRKAESAVH